MARLSFLFVLSFVGCFIKLTGINSGKCVLELAAGFSVDSSS